MCVGRWACAWFVVPQKEEYKKKKAEIRQERGERIRSPIQGTKGPREGRTKARSNAEQRQMGKSKLIKVINKR